MSLSLRIAVHIKGSELSTSQSWKKCLHEMVADLTVRDLEMQEVENLQINLAKTGLFSRKSADTGAYSILSRNAAKRQYSVWATEKEYLAAFFVEGTPGLLAAFSCNGDRPAYSTIFSALATTGNSNPGLAISDPSYENLAVFRLNSLSDTFECVVAIRL